MIPQTGEDEYKYITWNKLIVDYFFNPDKAGKEVILFLNEEAIKNIGKENGMGMVDFIQAIINGTTKSSKDRVCQEAKELYSNWKDARIGVPPYVGYLAFFVLVAATQYEDVAPNAYYPKFWKLLGGQDTTGTPKGFHEMHELWDDLERWTKEDKNEEFGIFKVRIRGGMRHIGIPLFQSLCSNEELNNLPTMFEAAELDPMDPPNPEVILGIMIGYKEQIFTARTIKMLKETSIESSAFREALVMMVLDKLEEWDYTSPSIGGDSGTRNEQRFRAGLRICMNIDPASHFARCYLRFQSRKPIPDDGLTLHNTSGDEEYSCSGYINNWSSPLKESETLEDLDGRKLDWEQGGRLHDANGKWTAKLRASGVRVFKEGVDGLKDWVEVQRIERKNKYTIACSARYVDEITAWGENSVGCFKPMEVDQGLPQAWHLFECSDIQDSCKEIKQLTVSSFTRVSLREGITSKGRNLYFSFALPNVVIEGGKGDERLIINGQDNGTSSSNGEWHIQEPRSDEKVIRIEVKRGEDSLYRTSIKIESFETMPDLDGTPCRNAIGEITSCQTDEPLARGGFVTGIDEVEHYKDQLPFHLSNRILFIGKVPGQVVEWPKKEINEEWDPEWAIIHVKKKFWEVHFVGNPMSRPMIIGGKNTLYDKGAIKLWREATYNRRKTTKKPEILRLKKLWEEYQECGKDVK